MAKCIKFIVYEKLTDHSDAWMHVKLTLIILAPDLLFLHDEKISINFFLFMHKIMPTTIIPPTSDSSNGVTITLAAISFEEKQFSTRMKHGVEH